MRSFDLIKPCPNISLMIKLRKIHNINLSVLSVIILTGLAIGNYQEDKFYPSYNLLCKSYNNNYYAVKLYYIQCIFIILLDFM